MVRRLIDAYEAADAGAAVAVREVPAEFVSRYGIVAIGAARGTAFEVEDVVEKPDPGSARAGSRSWAATCSARRCSRRSRRYRPVTAGEIQLSDALRQVIREGGRVVAVPLSEGERRHDVGTLEGYCAAFLEYALSDDRFGAALRARAAALLDADD